MTRYTVLVFAVAVAFSMCLLDVAPSQQLKGKYDFVPAQPAAAQPAKQEEAKPASGKELDVDVVAALNKRMDFQGMKDPKATLDDALALLSKQYGVTFEINMRAFINEGSKEPGLSTIADPELPAAKNVRLKNLLNRILTRLPCISGATFLVRRDSIEITTNTFAHNEIWGDESEGPFLPLVHVRAEKLALSEVLTQLADQSGVNIVLAATPETAATPITVRLTNVPVDTAVALLADQAGLGVVHRDNVLLVTTAEKANLLKIRFAEENPEHKTRFRRGGAPTFPMNNGM